MTEVVVTLESAPQAEPEQPEPESAQVTPLLAESFWTEAVKFDVVEIRTEADVGLTETEIGGGAAVTVIEAEPDLVASATEVALMVTVGGVGTVAGAL